MDEIIYKSIVGEPLTSREKQSLEIWLASERKHAKIYLELEAALNRDTTDLELQKEKIWKKAESRLNERRISSHSIYWGLAAAIALLIAVGFIFFRSTDDPQADQQIVLLPELIEKQTLKGQKLNVQLSDGSRIKLNAESRLLYPDSFNSERRVEIEGEAFFEITKSNIPFVVKTRDAEIRVLGTSFNVNTREDKVIEVAVASGEVSFTATDQEMLLIDTLSPGQMVHYRKEKHFLEITPFDSLKILGWKDKMLVFREEALSEVFDQLNLWFGVTFLVNDRIDFTKEYNATFSNPTLEEVLVSLGHSYSFNFKIINDKQVKIIKE